MTLTLPPRFKYGARSLAELEGVHPDLVLVCTRAIARSTEVDWAVHDGIRTLEQQREYLRTGVSQTLNSKHLEQPDGFGHAVDLVPYINGRLRWELKPCIEIARLIRAEAIAVQLELTWGAVWDRQLDELDPIRLEQEIEAYVARRKKLGRKAFIDAPHFEVFW